MKISATILTKNSARTLEKTLSSLKFLDEIILIDNGSCDNTLAIAKKFSNVKVFEEKFTGFGPLHNLAIEKASNDWILSIDSDEVITKELKETICNINLDCDCVYSFAFQNILFGKKVRFSGWYPDRHVRIFNRTKTGFSNDFVHEKILTDGLKEIKLKEHVDHYSYLETADFLRKLQIYTDLFRDQNLGKKSSFSKALTHAIYAFIKTYFLKLGFLDGKNGFIIAFYQFQTAFYKYLKLWEANNK